VEYNVGATVGVGLSVRGVSIKAQLDIKVPASALAPPPPSPPAPTGDEAMAAATEVQHALSPSTGVAIVMFVTSK
jgi:hypothetical protein